MERVSILLFLSCSLVAAIHAGDLQTCARNYKKVGCFTDKSDQSKSMLVYDRYGIQWKNIEAYLHGLACRCETEARKNTTYAGFAIHFWGECYGKTQAQLDAVDGKTQSLECTGDRNYDGCSADAKECAGHAYTDFVYELTEQSKAKDVEQTIQDCNGTGGISLTCSQNKRISLTTLSYSQRTASICGDPLTTGWETKCAYFDSNGWKYFKGECNGKTSCMLPSWKGNKNDLCPRISKYLEVKYKCIESI